MLKFMTILSILATNMLFAVNLDCQPSLTVKTTTKRKSSLSSRFVSKKHYKKTTTTTKKQLKSQDIELSRDEEQILYIPGAGLNLRVSQLFDSGDSNVAFIQAMRGQTKSKEFVIDLDRMQDFTTSFQFAPYEAGRKGDLSSIQKTLHLSCDIY